MDKIHRDLYEKIIFEKILEEAFNVQAFLLKAVKDKELKSNALTDYIDSRKGVPTHKELVHKLINQEFQEESILFNLETSYSKVIIYGMKYNQRSLFIIEFNVSDEEKPLRYGFTTEYGLTMAADVNFSYKTDETIANGNFILCEMLEILAILDLLEGSTQ